MRRRCEIKKNKICVFLRMTTFLDHLTSGKDVYLLPEKLQSITNLPIPKTPKEFRQMLGWTRYYHKFRPAYADLLQPWTELTHRTIPFTWMEQCQKAFEMMKYALMKSHILIYPDPNKPYTLFMDASKYVWSALLTQEYRSVIDIKTLKHQHLITYISGYINGLFQGSQLNLAI